MKPVFFYNWTFPWAQCEHCIIGLGMLNEGDRLTFTLGLFFLEVGISLIWKVACPAVPSKVEHDPGPIYNVPGYMSAAAAMCGMKEKAAPVRMNFHEQTKAILNGETPIFVIEDQAWVGIGFGKPDTIILKAPWSDALVLMPWSQIKGLKIC